MVMVFSLVPTFASNENVYMNTEKCYQNAAQQEYVSERVTEIIEELRLKDRNTYTQINMIDKWIHENIEYDHEKADQFVNFRRTAYSGLKNGYTVCVGFSQLGMEFCRQLGIPCEYVYCKYDNNERTTHVMLIVEIETPDGKNQWYYWDITSKGKTLFGEEYANVFFDMIAKTTSYYNNTKNKVAKNSYEEDYDVVYSLTGVEMTKNSILEYILKQYCKGCYFSGMHHFSFNKYGFDISYYIHEEEDGYYKTEYRIYQGENVSNVEYVTSVYIYNPEKIELV